MEGSFQKKVATVLVNLVLPLRLLISASIAHSLHSTYRMIERYCIDGVEKSKVVLVWSVVAMPRNNVKRGMILF